MAVCGSAPFGVDRSDKKLVKDIVCRVQGRKRDVLRIKLGSRTLLVVAIVVTVGGANHENGQMARSEVYRGT